MIFKLEKVKEEAKYAFETMKKYDKYEVHNENSSLIPILVIIQRFVLPYAKSIFLFECL